MTEKVERTLASETIKKVGEKVVLKGWAQTIRDHGSITFIDLRDRSGIVQCVGDKDLQKVTAESVVEVAGKVAKRPGKLVNPNIETGKVEVQIESLKVITAAGELPLPIDGGGYEIDENVRTKYRYLDLRRPRLNSNIRVRSYVTKFIRDWLIERDFVEIETPILTKTTPEGARDFLVPSRLQKGKFYALPQSPQQYKQLLMVAGFERYFQIARCFRDEDPRADRAYGEFTQLDLEMSFITQEDILKLSEELFTQLVTKIFPKKKIAKSPWPRIAHKEAMAKYHTDKPDLRKDKGDKDELAFAWIIDFPLFNEQTKEDFYYGSGASKRAPSHHMFTAPHPDDVKLLDKDPGKVRGLQHDLVLNGYEVGGGSVRIHDPKIQDKVFELIGFSETQKKQFEHMLTAFTFGVPPHGGIAPGIDRFIMAALGEPSVREVMAFPATAGGQIAVMDAPSEASGEQLKELGLTIAKK
ncbi:aspartate--tRNA ligase [Candidatus Woesebacteria bacterium]|nr:aspartate--tRNA ligase [Candidatus Woesebacteria bacterium]